MSQLQVTGEAKIRDIQGPVIANSGVITALDGAASQYVRGDGTLADFPTSTGGGSSVSYYLNGSINQGTFAGSTYYEMSKTPIIGAGTDFPVSTNGLVSQFITDANDPDLLEVPGGNFNVEFYFSVSNNTGNPTVYAELYKYDGTTFTLLGSSQAIPESINQGTTIAPYYFAIPVGTAALNNTDRIAIRIYANVDGRTVTLHTENSHLCQVVTTFSKGLISLNNLTKQNQFFATGTSGTNFAIVSSGDTHTFNLPVASATNTGKLSNTDWSTFNNKVPYTGATGSVDLGNNDLTADGIYAHNIVATKDGIASGTLGIQQGTGSGVPATGFSLISSSGNFFELKTTTGIANSKLANIDLSGLTNNTTRTYTLPDASGTLALTSNLSSYVPYTGATNSVDLGVYSLSADTVNGVGIFSVGSGTQSGFIGIKQGTTFLGNISGYNSINANATKFILTSDVGSTNYKSASFQLGSLTNNTERTYTLPDLSGTLALLEGSQTFSGSKTFSANPSINAGGQSSLSILSSTGNSALILGYVNNILKGTIDISATEFKLISAIDNILKFQSSNNFRASLIFSNSADYSYTFPAATGTIALTSNLSSYVPYTGATTNVDLGVYNLSANQVIAGGAGVNNAGTFTTYDGGVATQLIGSTGNLKFFPLWNPSIGARINAENSAGSAYIPLSFYASNFYFHSNVNFNSTIGNGTYSYTLPSATGTLALTSQIPANPVGGTGTTNYLPKFTGASTIGNSLVYDDGTNVGIGTNAPTSKLTVLGDAIRYAPVSLASGNAVLVIKDDGSNGTLDIASEILGNANAVSNPITFRLSNVSAGRFEAMRLDASGNLGLGVTPSAWSGFPAIQFTSNFSISALGTGKNAYFDGTDYRYISTNYASLFQQTSGGVFAWFTAPSGTAGNAISFTQAMTLDASGRLGIGTSSPATLLHIASSGNTFLTIDAASASNSGLTFYKSGAAAGAIYYLGASDAMRFDTANTERMRITSSGNLLVGTTTDAGYKLDINGYTRVQGSGLSTIFTGNDIQFTRGGATYITATGTGSSLYIGTNNVTDRLVISSTGAATFSSSVTATTESNFTGTSVNTRIFVTASGVANTVLGFNNSGSTTTGVSNNTGYVGVLQAYPLAFITDSVERMRITSDGKLLVGTSTDYGYKAVIAGNLYVRTGSAGTLCNITDGVAQTFQINTTASGFDITNPNSGYISFSNTTERMRITSGGNVLIGTTSDSATSGAGSKFVSNGRLYTVSSLNDNTQESLSMYSTGAGAYRFYVGWGGTIYATSTSITAISDERLKENVRPLNNSLSIINSLNPVMFDWKKGKGLDKKDDIGFIAQEFEKVFPNSVTESLAGEDGIAYKALNHSELIPTLVKAIQEQTQIIKDLEARIKQLENK